MADVHMIEEEEEEEKAGEDEAAGKKDVSTAEKEDSSPMNADSGQAAEKPDEPAPDVEEEDYGFKWQDSGKVRNGRREYESVLLTLNETTFRVSKNDFVLLWGVHNEEEDNDPSKDMETIEEIWQSAGCAKVEAMWEQTAKSTGSKKAMFKARWFFQKHEISRVIDTDEIIGNISLEQLKTNLKNREVVGSLEVGTYSMNTIGGPARVFFRDAPQEGEPANTGSEAQLPKDAFMCRYSLKKVENAPQRAVEAKASATKKGKVKLIMEVVPYEPASGAEESDNEGEKSRNSNSGKKRRRSDSDSDTMGEGDYSGQEGSSSDEESRSVQGEGPATLQGKIRQGAKYQVPVPPFDPKAKRSSRKPTLVWSSSQAPDQEKINAYFQKAADILTPFAKQQLLTVGTEPFTLRPPFQTDDQKRTRDTAAPWTVSFTSTATGLASLPPESMLRECDVDALLKNLHDQKYDVEAAVVIVSASPRDFLGKWTDREREGFDAAFRTHGGSLRSVAVALSSLSSENNHRQVVDYYYRFKIPGQFKRYRDKMREQAVRMIECIETKRSQEKKEVQVTHSTSRFGADSNSAPAAENKIQAVEKGAEVGNWSETGTGDVPQAVEERRSDAKKVLLDIQREMGKDKMAEVAGAVISMNQGNEAESKGALLRILKNSPELHARLVEFLPRRYWK